MAEEFRLGIGGPLHRFESAAHLDTLGRQLAAATLITWVPLIVLAAIESALGRSEPMLRDMSVHTRLLVALPLFLLAERVLDLTSRETVQRLFNEGFVGVEQQQRVRKMLQSVERWRDSPWPETVLLATAVLVGIGSLAGLLPPAGFLHGVHESRYSATRTWYGLVSLPIFQFFFWRALFRWGLWVRVLGGLSRVPLRLIPWHADRRGGISFLKRTSLGYCALFLFAESAILCAGWGTQMILYGTKIDTFKPLFSAFVVIGALLALLPLLIFVPQLFAARRRGQNELGALVSDYGRAFGDRWMCGDRAGLLGTSDIQSLADISTSYQDNVEKMTLSLVGPRDLALLCLVSNLPALPILLIQMPGREVLGRILHILMGGMAG
jgi:hypothetical protein